MYSMINMMTLDEKTKIIKGFPLFQNLADSQVQTISEAVFEKEFLPGDILVDQGDRSDGAYFIISGSVKVYRISLDGNPINIAILGSGEVVGEMSLVDEEPRSATVEAIQKTKTLVLTKSNLLRVLSQNTQTAMALLKTFSARVRAADDYIEEIFSKHLTERTLHLIQTLAKHFPNREITLSQEELAEILGATRARVTEALNSLASQGLVTLSHRKIHLK